MGLNNSRQVPCDRWTGQMDYYALDQMITEDK